MLYIGWREVVALPDYNLTKIKAKIDTGANTSALHADDIKIFESKKIIQFVYEDKIIRAPLIGIKQIKSSTGQSTLRPIIETSLAIGPYVYSIELSLINRDLMGFKMLLGRKALHAHFLINPSKSYLLKSK